MTILIRTSATIIVSACIVLCAWGVAQAQVKLENPLSSNISTIPQFVAAVLRAMVMIALPIIALFVVYSGFLFVLAQGNQEKLAVAKRNFLFVIIGGVLILGAWVLASLIGSTITELTR